MKRQLRRLQVAAVISLVLALVMTSVAAAITITVDGTRESAWDGASGQTPGNQFDDNESTIDDRYDIQYFNWTNDSLGGVAPYGYMYFLATTYGNFDPDTATNPTIIVCLNVDNSTTGNTVSGYCNNMSGVDRRIRAYPALGTVDVYRANGLGAWILVSNPTSGMRATAYLDENTDGIADEPYIEIGVDLQSLNITSSSACLSNMPIAIYYDNGMGDLEDNITDSGTFNIGCGTPTAITLTVAKATSATPLFAGLAVSGGLLAAGGLVIFRRRRM